MQGLAPFRDCSLKFLFRTMVSALMLRNCAMLWLDCISSLLLQLALFIFCVVIDVCRSGHTSSKHILSAGGGNTFACIAHREHLRYTSSYLWYTSSYLRYTSSYLQEYFQYTSSYLWDYTGYTSSYIFLSGISYQYMFSSFPRGRGILVPHTSGTRCWTFCGCLLHTVRNSLGVLCIF